MSVWRAETLSWKILALFGLACGGFALFLASWSMADAYLASAMPWSLVGLLVIVAAGLALMWATMVSSGRNGLVWSAHWLIGWVYLIPVGKPPVALIYSAILLPIAGSQVLVGYRARRDFKHSESAAIPVSRPMTAVRALASIVVLVVFLAGFRLSGFACPMHRSCIWEVSHLSSLRFPDGAKLVNGYIDYSFAGSMVLAELEMPGAEANMFVRSLPPIPSWARKPSRDPHDILSGNGPDPEYAFPKWFAPPPGRCTVYHPVVDGWDSVNVLVTRDNPNRATVYIYCYED